MKKIKSINPRIKKVLIIGTPLAIGATGVGIFFALNDNQTAKKATDVRKKPIEIIKTTTSSVEPTSHDNLFGFKDMNTSDAMEIYDSIHFRNESVVIENDFKKKFLEVIIRHSPSYAGSFSFSDLIVDNDYYSIAVKFMPSGPYEEMVKTYTLKITDSLPAYL